MNGAEHSSAAASAGATGNAGEALRSIRSQLESLDSASRAELARSLGDVHAEERSQELREHMHYLEGRLETVARISGLPVPPEAEWTISELADEAKPYIPDPAGGWQRSAAQRQQNKKATKSVLARAPHFREWAVPLDTKRPEVLAKLEKADKHLVLKLIPERVKNIMQQIKLAAVSLDRLVKGREMEAKTYLCDLLTLLHDEAFSLAEQQRSTVYQATSLEHLDPMKQPKADILPKDIMKTLATEDKVRQAFKFVGGQQTKKQSINGRTGRGGQPFRGGKGGNRRPFPSQQRNNYQNSSKSWDHNQSGGHHQFNSNKRSFDNQDNRGGYKGKNYNPDFKRQRP